MSASRLCQLPDDVVWHYLVPLLDPPTLARLAQVTRRHYAWLGRNASLWQRIYERGCPTWRRERELFAYLQQQAGTVCAAYGARCRLERLWREGQLAAWPRNVWQCPSEVHRTACASGPAVSVVRIGADRVAVLGDRTDGVPALNTTSTVALTDILTIPEETLAEMDMRAAALSTTNPSQQQQQEQQQQAKTPEQETKREDDAERQPWKLQKLALYNDQLLVFAARNRDASPILIWDLPTRTVQHCIFGGFFKYLRLVHQSVIGLRRSIDLAAYHLQEPAHACQTVVPKVDTFVGQHPWLEHLYVSFDRFVRHHRIRHDQDRSTTSFKLPAKEEDADNEDVEEFDIINLHLWDTRRGHRYAIDAPPQQVGTELAVPVAYGQLYLAAHTTISISGAQLISETAAVVWGISKTDVIGRHYSWVARCELAAQPGPKRTGPTWTHQASLVYDVQPMPEYDRLVVSSEMHCEILNATTGHCHWQVAIGGGSGSTLTHFLGPLFLLSHDENGTIGLLDVLTGQRLWDSIDYRTLTGRGHDDHHTTTVASALPRLQPWQSQPSVLVRKVRIPPLRLFAYPTRLLFTGFSDTPQRAITLQPPLFKL